MRVQFHTGLAVNFGAEAPLQIMVPTAPRCAGCGNPMHRVLRLIAPYKERGPPMQQPIQRQAVA
jgi:hypothetical protein